MTAPTKVIPHGTNTGYTYGCREECCRSARTAYGRRRHRQLGYGTWKGRLDATGTRRRAQALLAIGWSYAEQADRVGMGRQAYDKMIRNPTVYAHNAETVARLYEDLSGTPAPASWVHTRARRLAARMGYAPPLAWDDDTIDDPASQPVGLDAEAASRTARLASDDVDWVAVDRVVERGRRLDPDLWPTMTGGDRRAVVARLLELRRTQSQIGDHLRLSGTTLAEYLPARTEVAA